MIKVSLFGKNSNSIRDLIPQFGLEISEDNPDVIISYGGDGTLLSAERKFPGIPKLPIRDSRVCKKCSEHTTENLLKSLSEEKIELKTFPKLEAKFLNHTFLALNDIVIRNSNQIQAIRFTLKKNGESINEIIIGDGIVTSTPFGSSGYYQSVTGKTFSKDLEVAFNNTTEKLPPLPFTESDLITLEIIRGPATLSSDNNPEFHHLKEHDIVEISASPQKASIYSPDTLRCPNCKIFKDKRLDS